jgi:hypothetical protein
MLKTAIAVAWALSVLSAYAQLDRAGNVLDDGGGSGDGIRVVLIGIAIGSIIGMVWAKYQQSKGKDFATGGGAVIGGLIGMFAWPVISILAK